MVEKISLFGFYHYWRYPLIVFFGSSIPTSVCSTSCILPPIYLTIFQDAGVTEPAPLPPRPHEDASGWHSALPAECVCAMCVCGLEETEFKSNFQPEELNLVSSLFSDVVVVAVLGHFHSHFYLLFIPILFCDCVLCILFVCIELAHVPNSSLQR